MDTPVAAEEQLDGYGIPFPPEKQKQHLEWVLAARGDETFSCKLLDVPSYNADGWLDKPAGQYTRGSGI